LIQRGQGGRGPPHRARSRPPFLADTHAVAPPHAPHISPHNAAQMSGAASGGRVGELARLLAAPPGAAETQSRRIAATPEFSPSFPLSGRVLFAQTSSPFLPPFAACGKRRVPPPQSSGGAGAQHRRPLPRPWVVALTTLPPRPAPAGARPRPGSGRGGGAGERGSPADAGPTRSPRPPAPAPST